jgi:hypothetical protein
MNNEQNIVWVDKFMNYFTGPNVLELLLLILIGIVIYVMVRLHLNKNESFNIEDLVCVGGKLDEKKFTRFGAWIISTWGFLYILISNPNTFPEWYFMSYMGIWTAQVVIDKYLNKDNQSHRYSKTDDSSLFANTPVSKPAYSAKKDQQDNP